MRRRAWGLAVGRPTRRNAPENSEDKTSTWRRCRRKTRPIKVPLLPPLASARLAFPAGVIVETVNGCRQPEGTVRLFPGRPVYLDGSAADPGTKYATASCALVQYGPDGL